MTDQHNILDDAPDHRTTFSDTYGTKDESPIKWIFTFISLAVIGSVILIYVMINLYIYSP